MQNQSQPAFTNCTISGNKAFYDGGGFFCYQSQSTLINCIISGNESGDFDDGGAFYLWNAASATLTSCTIAGNRAYEKGGAVYTSIASVNFFNCILYDNTAHAIYEGTPSGSPFIKNSLFYANSDGDFFDHDAEGTPEDPNTLTGATSVNAMGGSVQDNVDGDPLFVSGASGTWSSAASYDASSNTTTLTDSSLTLTVDALAGELLNVNLLQRIHALVVANTETTITISGNFFSIGGSGVSYEVIDYHIQNGSGAQDLGLPIGAVILDMDGDPRPLNSIFDIGADEYAAVSVLDIVESARYGFAGYDTDNNGSLSWSEWAGGGFDTTYFGHFHDGSNSLTMADLLTESGLFPNSLSTVYVEFDVSGGGDWSENSPVRTLGEGLGLVVLDSNGVVALKPGNSGEVFTGSTAINPTARIILNWLTDGTSDPVRIGTAE